MSGAMMTAQACAALVPTDPSPAHMLGVVADDWAAIEVWLASVAGNSRNGSRETVATYRYHLAKLRWYCEHVAGLAPGRWSMQDVQAFTRFLADVPAQALCARVGKRFASPGEAGYTPFRKQPAPGSQSDILRFLKAMFGALHGTGYLRFNPMTLTRVHKGRRLDKTRALEIDVYQLVLSSMVVEEHAHRAARQLLLRDRFILLALRELGLRASELVGARMNAFERLSDPKSGHTYWIFRVDAANAKGGEERTVPVTRVALDALLAFRQGFGLAPAPRPDDTQPLLLSPRTDPARMTSGMVQSARNRRYFGAWGSIDTRHGLYRVVKARLGAAAQWFEGQGDTGTAARLAQASPHWLRHTFAMAQLLGGIDIRQVAGALGHASVTTTMAYTEPEAIDQIRAREQAQPGTLAREKGAG